MKFNGIFLGSGAARTIGLGFVPQTVLLRNLSTGAELLWDRDFGRATALGEGKVTAVASSASVPASLATALTGDNNDIQLYAATAGADGNDITLALVDPSGNDESLAVTVTDSAISASLATDGAGAITSTAAEVVAAINAEGDAAELVTAYLKSGNDGSGVVTALAATALSGGADGQLVSLLTAGNGIVSYEDAAAVASASVAAIQPTHMVPDYAGDMRGKGDGDIIDTWTLDTSGNRTGHFNAGVDTDLVKAGSEIVIDGKTYFIQSISNDGDAADEVTLNEAVAAGPVEKIRYPYDLAPIPAGQKIPRGIYLAETATVNVSGQLVQIQAVG